MTIIERRVPKPDGGVDVFVPSKNRHGKYVVAHREVAEPRLAVNQEHIATWSELVVLARTGDYHIRMTAPGCGAPSLISPGSYRIRELQHEVFPDPATIDAPQRQGNVEASSSPMRSNASMTPSK